jgi:hypothetical protein
MVSTQEPSVILVPAMYEGGSFEARGLEALSLAKATAKTAGTNRTGALPKSLFVVVGGQRMGVHAKPTNLLQGFGAATRASDKLPSRLTRSASSLIKSQTAAILGTPRSAR